MLSGTIADQSDIIIGESFVCSSCHREYPWMMRGGTSKLVANRNDYCDRNVTQCCYCQGTYPDGTAASGGKR